MNNNKAANITLFQKLVLSGIILVIILLTTLILMSAFGQDKSSPNQVDHVAQPPAATPTATPTLTPPPQDEQNDNTILDDTTNGSDGDDTSIGTKVGEVFLNFSHIIWEFLTDFNDVVDVTGFFRTGYREFFDAIRAGSGEELIEITLNRIADKNDVSVHNFEIVDDNTVKIQVQSDDETNVVSFCIELEKLSFIEEAYIADDTTDDDGMLVFEVIMIVGY